MCRRFAEPDPKSLAASATGTVYEGGEGLRRRVVVTGEQQHRVEVVVEDRGHDGNVAFVTYDRSRKLNAVGSAGLADLRETFHRLSQAPALRCVVFGGTGKGWIGGADIAEMAALTPAAGREFISGIHHLCEAIRDCPAPVIAAVNGFCLGAGPEIAAACDIRIASDRAVFGMPEVKVGVPSVVEAALLPRLIGWGRTADWLLVGHNIDAATAERWGLVQEVVPHAELEAAVRRRVDAIVANAPRAMRLQKKLMRRWEELPLGKAIEAGIDAFEESLATGEHRERMGAFLARRR
jgi:enoyl-CoA hydratase/carnithine racemase